MIKGNAVQSNFFSTRLLLVTVIGLGFLILAFKFFEPVFVYNFGWKEANYKESPPFQLELIDDALSQQSKNAETALRQFYADVGAPAISVAVSKENKLIWRGNIGYADLANNRAITFNDPFRLGSTSKAITSVAIARLVDKKQLEFNQTMGELAPSLDKRLHDITLEQAMSHRAGIRNYGLCLCFPVWEHLNRRNFASIRESVSLIERSDRLNYSGDSYQYTSLGYNLAGLAAEKATDKTFEEVLRSEVFSPLGMNSSGLEIGDIQFTVPYEVENGRYKPAFDVNNSIRWPSGGILSTPSDMVKLGNSMLNDRLLSNSVRNRILTIPKGGRKNGGKTYALGWRVSDWNLNDKHTIKFYHHNGVAVGSQSVFVVSPDNNLVISAMMNKNGTNVNDLSKFVRELSLIFANLN